ncbi:MAG: HNH endonuclease [Acidimicrobiia bacterium]|nr:HNH endonuclease [Acidimicrobiia bacterium]
MSAQLTEGKIAQGLELIRAGVAELDADLLDGRQARRLVEQFAAARKLVDAGTTLAVQRVKVTGAWAGGYHRDAATWLASLAGTSIGAARATLDTAEKVVELPATQAAMRSGRLSSAQANEVAAAASADPDAERELLRSAERDGMKTLKDRCARTRAAARTDEMANYERIRRDRSIRHFEDPDGTGRIDVRGPVDATARIMAQMVPFEKELFAAARTTGEYERPEAYAFDALVAMADASIGERAPAKASGSDTTVVVRLDVAALRGWTEPGEVCEIVGTGPIPVAVALRMAHDAFIKAIVTDGVDVHSVVHLGRKPPAVLETALAELYSQCVVEGCDVSRHLENDHNVPWSEGGPTRLSNLNPLCKYHHRYKHGHKLRLVGEGTNKRFVPATGWTRPDPPRRA